LDFFVQVSSMIVWLLEYRVGVDVHVINHESFKL